MRPHKNLTLKDFKLLNWAIHVPLFLELYGCYSFEVFQIAQSICAAELWLESVFLFSHTVESSNCWLWRSCTYSKFSVRRHKDPCTAFKTVQQLERQFAQNSELLSLKCRLWWRSLVCVAPPEFPVKNSTQWKIQQKWSITCVKPGDKLHRQVLCTLGWQHMNTKRWAPPTLKSREPQSTSGWASEWVKFKFWVNCAFKFAAIVSEGKLDVSFTQHFCGTISAMQLKSISRRWQSARMHMSHPSVRNTGGRGGAQPPPINP